jgi:Putative Ig domain
MLYLSQPSTAFFGAFLILVASLTSGCSDTTGSGSSTNSSSTSSTTSSSTDSSSGSTGSSSGTAKLSLNGTPALSAVPGVKYQFQPSVSQAGGHVTFSISGQPTWATFNSTTGELSGTPAQSMVGTNASVTISASNGTGTASIGPFTIIVTQAPGNGSIALSWSPPNDSADSPLSLLAGYYIYYGTNSADLSKSVLVFGGGTTEYVIQGLAPGTYYFAMTTYSAQGVQSDRSNIVSADITS